jgi:hypothetical protein
MYALLPDQLSDANKETLTIGCHYDYRNQKWADGHDHAHTESKASIDLLFCGADQATCRAGHPEQWSWMHA